MFTPEKCLGKRQPATLTSCNKCAETTQNCLFKHPFGYCLTKAESKYRKEYGNIAAEEQKANLITQQWIKEEIQLFGAPE